MKLLDDCPRLPLPRRDGKRYKRGQKHPEQHSPQPGAHRPDPFVRHDLILYAPTCANGDSDAMAEYRFDLV